VTGTQSVARYTRSFDAAAPGGASYSRPVVDVGFTGSFGLFLADDPDADTPLQFGVGYFEADQEFTARATTPDGTTVETLSMDTTDRGLELHVGMGHPVGPVGGLVVIRRTSIANRSGVYGGGVGVGHAYVVRPQIGAHFTGDSFSLFGTIGYDIPLIRGQGVLAGEFDPARQDFGEDPVRAGHVGPVASVRIRV
jgi:hypothetical protein